MHLSNLPHEEVEFTHHQVKRFIKNADKREPRDPIRPILTDFEGSAAYFPEAVGAPRASPCGEGGQVIGLAIFRHTT